MQYAWDICLSVVIVLANLVCLAYSVTNNFLICGGAGESHRADRLIPVDKKKYYDLDGALII